MSKKFIKKEGMALTCLARYLLGEQIGCRLKTIDELSTEFELSVGVVQNALKTLESKDLIALERRGRNGTVILNIDYEGLLSQADINTLVCAMPLPYTKLYEGLASGLKTQFNQVSLYFAHMRGADVRIECLLDGIYDMAVVSRLAAESYLQQELVDIALTLGPHTYVSGHHLICRQGQQDNIKRVGLDFRSPDQRLLTEVAFKKQHIELINIPYHDGLSLIEKGQIDAMIWNVTEDLGSHNLMKLPLNGEEIYQQAAEAVIVTRKGNLHINQLIKRFVTLEQLLRHQSDVQAGVVDPSY